MAENPPKVKFWYPRAVIYDPLKAGSIDGTDTEPHDKAVVRALNAEYKPNYKVKGVPENTIFISRLNRKTSERTLKEEFSRYGKIVRCRLVRDIITNFSRGYAFIEYETEREAKKAVDRGDRSVIDDKTVFVDHECERLLPGWVPRRLGGGFGGKKESGQLRFGGKDKQFAKPIRLMEEYELRNQLTSKSFKK
ncbi:U11/U12 small nuclear ribonucleoprotein 35 kDa protein-like [Planococcus citri]|uniref:U11/U12 small nuclear ribonucleoprotein 35 kDa protein-like n=1 Tax=Planococcus citri TaxID=170843 RepID=UPI0031F9C645